MSYTLKHDSRCVECKRRLRAGSECTFSVSEDGRYLHACVKCPEPRKGQNVAGDASDRYNVRTCGGKCKNTVAFLKPSLAAVCPYCDGEWERDIEPAVGEPPQTSREVERIDGEWWITNHCQDCDAPIVLPCGTEEPSPLAVKFARVGCRTCDTCHDKWTEGRR